MTPFTPAPIAISTERDLALRRRGESPEAIAFLDYGITPDQQHPWAQRGRLYVNDVYQVAVNDFPGGAAHLAVRRLDRQSITSWEDLQAIKDALVGEDCEGVELYPAQERRVKGTVHRHLWCQVEAGFRFPFGWQPMHTKKVNPLGDTVDNPPAGAVDFR